MNIMNDTHAEAVSNIIENKEMEVMLSLFQNSKFNFFQIEIYTYNPYIFVCRNKEKNVILAIEDNRLLISNNVKNIRRIADIPIEHIKDLKVVTYSKDEYEIKFKIKDLNYRLWIEL